MDMAQAVGLMIPECARIIGSANPVTTIMAVMKRPRSIGPEPSSKLVAYSSAPQQCGKTAFGSGARTNVKAKRDRKSNDFSEIMKTAHRQEVAASSAIGRKTG